MSLLASMQLVASEEKASKEIEGRNQLFYFRKALHVEPKHGLINLDAYVKQGGHVDDTMSNWSLLMRCASVGKKQAVQQLIDAGANTNFRTSSSLMTPYLAAKIHGQHDIARLIKQAQKKKTQVLLVAAPQERSLEDQFRDFERSCAQMQPEQRNDVDQERLRYEMNLKMFNARVGQSESVQNKNATGYKFI